MRSSAFAKAMSYGMQGRLRAAPHPGLVEQSRHMRPDRLLRAYEGTGGLTVGTSAHLPLWLGEGPGPSLVSRAAPRVRHRPGRDRHLPAAHRADRLGECPPTVMETACRTGPYRRKPVGAFGPADRHPHPRGRPSGVADGLPGRAPPEGTEPYPEGAGSGVSPASPDPGRPRATAVPRPPLRAHGADGTSPGAPADRSPGVLPAPPALGPEYHREHLRQ
jgi:hypothetical protein